MTRDEAVEKVDASIRESVVLGHTQSPAREALIAALTAAPPSEDVEIVPASDLGGITPMRAVVEPATRAAPQGWRLVPEEPTEEMLQCGASAQYRKEGRWPGTRATYAAMLAASPSAPRGKGEG